MQDADDMNESGLTGGWLVRKSNNKNWRKQAVKSPIIMTGFSCKMDITTQDFNPF